MDFVQLEYLVSVCDCETLSKAAQELHLSASALSRSMKRLEEELGVTLFERTRNSVVLNDVGQLAVEHARQLIFDADAMRSELQSLVNKKTEMRVGSCAPAPTWYFIMRAGEVSPGLPISCELFSSEALERHLLNGTVDVALMGRPCSNPDALSLPLMEETMNLSVPVDHPWAKREEVFIEEINGQSLMVHKNQGYWKEFCQVHLPQSKYVVHDDYMVFNQQLKSTSSLGLVTNTPAPPSIPGRVALPIADGVATAQFYLVMLPNKEERWAQMAREICSQA